MYFIFLKDNEVPTIKCPVEIQEITTEQEVSVIFDVVATDNLGEPTLSYNISGEDRSAENLFPADDEPKGIIATAKDSFGNKASCNFTLTVFSKGMEAKLKTVVEEVLKCNNTRFEIIAFNV